MNFKVDLNQKFDSDGNNILIYKFWKKKPEEAVMMIRMSKEKKTNKTNDIEMEQADRNE